MAIPDNVGDVVSLGECICNVDLCGRTFAEGFEFRPCDLAAIFEAATEGDIAKVNQILWSRRVWR